MDKLSLLLGVATVGLGSLSVHLLGELKEARDETETLQAQVADLERSRVVRGPVTPRDRPPPARNGPPDDTAPPPPQYGARIVAAPPPAVPASPSPEAAALMNRGMMDRAKLMEDPEYRAAVTMQQKVMLAQQYPDLAAAMNLTPGQVDQLLGLLAEQQTRTMQDRPPFRSGAQPDPNEVREWQQRTEQRRQENQEEIRQLLGDAGVDQWKEYQQSMGARSTVRQLRAVLDTAGIPLRQDQVEPLVNAIAAEQRANSQAQAQAQGAMLGGAAMPGVAVPRGQVSSTQDRVAMTERSIERMEQNNQRLRAAASAHLTTEQMRRYDQMLQQQLDMQRASLRMMRAQAEAEARGEVSPTYYSNPSVAGATTTSELRPVPGR